MEDVDAIASALETRLKAFPGKPLQASGAEAIAWENYNFTPETDRPYLSVFVLFAEPDDKGSADTTYIQSGYMQIGLHYPTNKGPGPARLQAKALRRYFPKGLSLVAGGVTTIVERVPTIGRGTNEEGRYVIRVTVRFFAQLEPQG